ncbi:MAG: hypothetical protein L0210_15910 [Rhodospirillales bacterium]|nr:hypothetical protein [Rhodospirillales bacterium]
MNATSELQQHGFQQGAKLQWRESGAEIAFEFVATDPLTWAAKHVILAVVDAADDQTLFVGPTGQQVRSRLGDLGRWLNGKRKDDSETPVRYAWLDRLKTCKPGEIEVWAKASVPGRAQREMEARRWIDLLRPVLNRR